MNLFRKDSAKVDSASDIAKSGDSTHVDKAGAAQHANEKKVIITKDMLISEVIQRKPRTIQTLMMVGLGCIGCPSSMMESVEEAAWVHGLDPDALVEKLNEC